MGVMKQDSSWRKPVDADRGLPAAGATAGGTAIWVGQQHGRFVVDLAVF